MRPIEYQEGRAHGLKAIEVKKIVTSVRLVYPGPRYRLEGSMRK